MRTMVLPFMLSTAGCSCDRRLQIPEGHLVHQYASRDDCLKENPESDCEPHHSGVWFGRPFVPGPGYVPSPYAVAVMNRDGYTVPRSTWNSSHPDVGRFVTSGVGATGRVAGVSAGEAAISRGGFGGTARSGAFGEVGE